MGKVGFTIVNIGTLSQNKYWGETERVRTPSATCTLLQTGNTRLLVDPSPEPGPLAALLFARTGLKPSDIDLIFLTHFHGDHRFGLKLFSGKPWLMAAAGIDEWKTQVPAEQELADRITAAEDRLPGGVSLLATPGHTPGHHSLAVATAYGTLVMAGDAVMTPDFYSAEDGFHNSADFKLVAATIQHIKATADLVIPGHGNLILKPGTAP